MFKSLPPGLLALVLMLFEYLSSRAAFSISPGVGICCISLLVSTPLRSREPTDVLGPIYNLFNTRHL
jgi:hypothetical protein